MTSSNKLVLPIFVIICGIASLVSCIPLDQNLLLSRTAFAQKARRYDGIISPLVSRSDSSCSGCLSGVMAMIKGPIAEPPWEPVIPSGIRLQPVHNPAPQIPPSPRPGGSTAPGRVPSPHSGGSTTPQRQGSTGGRTTTVPPPPHPGTPARQNSLLSGNPQGANSQPPPGGIKTPERQGSLPPPPSGGPKAPERQGTQSPPAGAVKTPERQGSLPPPPSGGPKAPERQGTQSPPAGLRAPERPASPSSSQGSRPGSRASTIGDYYDDYQHMYSTSDLPIGSTTNLIPSGSTRTNSRGSLGNRLAAALRMDSSSKRT